jgi:outer membrane protein TolC
MMAYKAKLLTLFLLGFFTVTLAQVKRPPVDSSNIFLLRDLQELVLRNHPVAKQAALLSKEASARVLAAFGKFDPALAASFGSKMFGGSEYYNHWESELKVPLWLAGAELKIGYDRNVGIYNNPETRTNNTGLARVGLSIPLGQGLLIDSRRNTLRQAQVMLGYAEAEKISQINELWYTAGKDYWSWYFAFQQYRFIREGVDLAQRRFVAIREQVLLGDKPPIDSVEAGITLQDRVVQLRESEVELTNARLILSNHLWNKDGLPQELPAIAIPQEVSATAKIAARLSLDSLLGQARDNHPELLKLRTEQAQLDIERRYRQEMLKPKLNVSGNLLAGRRDPFVYVNPRYDFNFSNYKVGLDFALPLFLREERGKLREVKIKQTELQYGLQQTGRVLQTGVQSSYNEVQGYQSQVEIQSRNVESQRILLRAELQKFELGESNLFLINTRETKLIDMEVKKAELESKFQKSIAEVYYRAGNRVSL